MRRITLYFLCIISLGALLLSTGEALYAASDAVNVDLTVTAASGSSTSTPSSDSSDSSGGGGGGGGAPYPIVIKDSSDTSGPVIEQLRVTNITPSGGVVTWSTDELANAQVSYGKTDSLELPSKTNSTFKSEHAITLANLSSDTRYFARVRSGDQSGNLTFSQVISFRTLAIAATPTVPNASDLEAIPGDGTVTLSWTLPASDSIQSAIVRRSTDTYPAIPTAGIGVIDAPASTAIDDGLTNDTRYFYTLFLRDGAGNVSSGVIISAIPRERATDTGTESGQADEQTGQAPAQTQEPERIDLSVVLSLENGPLLVRPRLRVVTQEARPTDPQTPISSPGNADDDGSAPSSLPLPRTEAQLIVASDTQFDIHIDTRDVRKDVTNVIARLNNTTYLLNTTDGGLLFSAGAVAPKLPGRYPMKIEVNYSDGTTQSIETVVLIDPFGYVFEMTDRGEQRLSDATVTLYHLDEQTGEWRVWPADVFSQSNPQITEQTGEFAFFVPAGRYYLSATKFGYHSAQTDEFDVIDQIVNVNIELQSADLPAQPLTGGTILNRIGFWIIGLASIAGVVLIIFILVKYGMGGRRKKRKQRKSFSTDTTTHT